MDFTPVPWFNGGLFDTGAALPLGAGEVALVQRAAALDWADVDPSILGTLFERGLDPDKRSQLGAHYTDRAKIELLVDPVVRRPLQAEWDMARAGIEGALGRAAAAKAPAPATKARNEAAGLLRAFLDRLRSYRVLDPACARATSSTCPCSRSRTWSTGPWWKPRRWACNASSRRSGRRRCWGSS